MIIFMVVWTNINPPHTSYTNVLKTDRCFCIYMYVQGNPKHVNPAQIIQKSLWLCGPSHSAEHTQCISSRRNALSTSTSLFFAAACKSRSRWYCSVCSNWDIKARSSARCLLMGWGCISYTAGNTLNSMAFPTEGTRKATATLSTSES